MSKANSVTPAEGTMSKSAFFTFLYKGALSVLTFVNSVLAARFLGKVDRFEFQYAGTVATMGQRFVGGFANYYSYRLPRNPELAEDIANTGNLVIFTMSLIVWAITLVLAFGHIPYVHLPATWMWALLCIPLNFIFVYGTRLLQGTNSIAWLNRANTMQSVAFFVILLPLFLAGRHLPESVRLTATFVSWLASFAVTGAATMLIGYHFVARLVARRQASGAPIRVEDDALPLPARVSWREIVRWKFIREHWSGTLNYGGWFTASNVANYVNYRIDLWLVFAFIPLKVGSDYGIAVTASEVLLNISGSVAQVVYTRMISSQRKDAIQLAQTSTRQTLVSCGIVAVAMYAIFPWLIVLAYGEKYSGAIVPFCILLPGVIFRASGNVVMQYATNTLGRPRTTVWMNLVSAAINGIFCLILLGPLQITGGAIASSASYVLSYLVILWWFQRQSQRPMHEMWPLHKNDYMPYVRVARRLLRIH